MRSFSFNDEGSRGLFIVSTVASVSRECTWSHIHAKVWKKGAIARDDGVKRSANPYYGRVPTRGRVNGLRGFVNAWACGWDAADQLIKEANEELSKKEKL